MRSTKVKRALEQDVQERRKEESLRRQKKISSPNLSLSRMGAVKQRKVPYVCSSDGSFTGEQPVGTGSGAVLAHKSLIAVAMRTG